ncbi:hypothetical protein EAG_07568 [Camponotus floridanus]|uniref:Uncharacterized protein n=1 Tax=Camponotus floridanus TaxID=104421 RepID=E2A451_CAMFO|nr:hypothetical protein EAG_07568 [Camponotus floridanus]
MCLQQLEQSVWSTVNTNEEPARRGLLHTLMRISRRLRLAPQDVLITKSSFAITVLAHAYYLLLRVANSHAIRAAGSIVRLICDEKDVPRSDCSYFASIAITIMELLFDSESFTLTTEMYICLEYVNRQKLICEILTRLKINVALRPAVIGRACSTSTSEKRIRLRCRLAIQHTGCWAYEIGSEVGLCDIRDIES